MNQAKLTVKAQPRAKLNQVIGFEGDVLKLRVTAPPVEGKANQAITELLAETLRIPKKAVILVHGEKSKLKAFRIDGLSAEEVKSRLSVKERRLQVKQQKRWRE